MGVEGGHRGRALRLETSAVGGWNLGLLNAAVAYILGYVIGDGNLSKTSYLIRLYDSNREFVENVLAKMFREAFNVRPLIYYDRHNNSYVLYKSSKKIWLRLRSLGVPAGKKAKTVSVPETIIDSKDEIVKREFLSGIFDAEACVTSFRQKHKHPRGYTILELKMSNPHLIIQISELLSSITDIKVRTYVYTHNGILRINGRRQVVKAITELNLKHPRFTSLRAGKKHGPGSARSWRA